MIKNYLSITVKQLALVLFLSVSANMLAQVPVVKFGANKRVVEQYDYFKLFDSSTNNPTEWIWNVYDSTTYSGTNFYPTLSNGNVISDPQGNGSNEFSKNPEFSIDVPGVYTVTLKCKNASGWSTLLVKKAYIKMELPSDYNLGYGTFGKNNDNVVDGDHGTIFDNGGPNLKYGNDQGFSTRAYLTIKPCNAKKIILNMTQLKFADANDVLYVYDADKQDNSKLLAAWTKNNTSGKTVTALSGNMYILFVSDGAGVDSGFAGAYTVELDTTSGSASLDIIRDTAVYNSTPVRFSYVSQGIYGTPTFTWTIDNNQAPNSSKKDLNYTFFTDGKYKICLNVQHCKGSIKVCDTINVVTPHKKTKLNFKTSATYSNAFSSVVLSPVADNANRFKWVINPKSYILLNPPGAPSSHDTSGIYYNATYGDSFPKPRIRLLDTVCYTIKLIAYNSLDPVKTADTLIKANYVCGKDFRDVYGLYGKVFHDQNSNCLLSGGEPGIMNIPIKLYDSTNKFIGQTYTLENGLFGFEKTQGTYKVVIDKMGLSLKGTCSPGLDTTVTFSKQSPMNGLNFALECAEKVIMGVQSVFPRGRVFPGQTHTLSVNTGILTNMFGIQCASPSMDSGIVKIKVVGKVSYLGVPAGSRTPSSIGGNVFTYHVADFNKVNNKSDFRLNFKTDTSAKSTDSVHVLVQVLPKNSAKDSSKFEIFYKVFNSYDPNEKQVYPTYVPPAFNNWLTYTIHFQNTGNAPAYNIRLEDTLAQELDLETFEVMDFSHANRIALKDHLLKVYFDDIMLPDSNEDKDGSNGFIQYRIKPKQAFPIGTRIRNTAYIYFDYNAAVVTNTAITEYKKDASHIRVTMSPQLRIYPNPGDGFYHILNPEGDQLKIEIYNLLGELILSKSIESSSELLDISQQVDGIYILKVFINGEVQVFKLIKD